MKKKTLGRWLALLLACMMIVSMAACGKPNTPTESGKPDTPTESGKPSEAPPPADPTKDTIKVAVTNDMGTLDPAQNSGTDLVGPTTRMIHEPLWYFDSDGEIVWMLATGYEWMDDVTIRIHVREGVNFMNGEILNAHDVLYSLIRYNHREGQGAMFRFLDEENSSVVDEYTVDMKLNEVNTSIPLTMGQYAIVRNNVTMDEAARSPNGTGPYAVTDYVINSHLYLSRRDDYWGELPATKNFQFLQLKEEAQRTNALQTGTVDVAAVPFQDVDFVRSLPGINLEITPSHGQQVIFFNVSDTSVFHQNEDARRAVTYAVDTAAIRRLVYNDLVDTPKTVMQQHVTDMEDRYFQFGGVYESGQDLELAKQYAESAGIIGKELRLINNGAPAAVLTCELIQADLKKIGVEVDVRSYDMGSWTTYLFDDTQYDMCFDGNWALQNTVTSALKYSVENMSAYAYKNYPWNGSEEVLERLATIYTVDETTQKEWRYEVSKAVADAYLWISLADMVNTWAINEGVAGNARQNTQSWINWHKLYWAQ